MKKIVAPFLYLIGAVAVYYLSGITVVLLIKITPFIDWNSSIGSAISSLLVYVLTLVILTILLPKIIKSTKIDREALGLTGLPTWTDIGLGVVGVIVALLVSFALNQLFLNFSWYEEIANQPQDTGFYDLFDPVGRVIAFITLVIVAPVAEELIFRGWIYGKMRKTLPAIVVALIISLAFGALHGQWNVALATFSLSTVCCIGREITGTIYAGVIVHILNNALALFVLFLG